MRLIAFILAAFAGIFAIFLRFSHGHPLRQYITHAIDYDGRAAVEHLLIACALPLLCGMMLNIGSSATSGSNISRRHHKMRFFDAIARWDERGPVVAMALAYFVIQLAFECYQAVCSVYGGPPRGYVQIEQIMADAGGCWLAYKIISWVTLSGNAAAAHPASA